MSVTFDDYVTLISLGISSVSLAVVIFLFFATNKLSKTQYHNQITTTPSDNEVEVSAVVSEFTQRLRRLEESLVDQKVKMEIMELRAQRGTPREVVTTTVAPMAYSRVEEVSMPPPLDNPERPSILSGMKTPLKSEQVEEDRKLGGTEMEALRLVFEGRGKISAREIQQRIGRTREHTARMMNSLYHDGLVERDVTARPFSYSITEKGREVLNG